MDVPIHFLQSYDSHIKTVDKYKVVQSALNKVPLSFVNINQNAINKLPFSFNHEIVGHKVATDQANSGRCWIFAALNVIAAKMIQKYKLPEEFQLSQAFIYKFDKFEKCNAALEIMWDLRLKGKDNNSLEYISLVPSKVGGGNDGGTIQQFMKVINKYGIVPQEAFPDNRQASYTTMMNDMLSDMMNMACSRIMSCKSRKEFEKIKKKVLEDSYRVISLFLGNTPTTFEWKSKMMSPYQFYHRVVKKAVNFDDFVCIVNDPRNEYGKLLCVEYLENVISKKTVSLQDLTTNMYLNVDMKVFKNAVYETISKHKTPVWFATDFSKFVMNESSYLDQNSSVIGSMFDIEILQSKGEAMKNRVIQPNHAMILSGVQMSGGVYKRWKVENSHGTDNAFNGFLVMSDKFFDQFVLVGWVHKDTLPSGLVKDYIEKTKDKRVKLPFWDILGTFAV